MPFPVLASAIPHTFEIEIELKVKNVHKLDTRWTILDDLCIICGQPWNVSCSGMSILPCLRKSSSEKKLRLLLNHPETQKLTDAVV